MTRKQFIKILKDLKLLIDDIDNVHVAMKKLDPNFGGFCISRVDTLILDVLEVAMDDQNDWISYYVYDLNWGKDWEEGKITSKAGEDIQLKTFNDLYNILIIKK